jgi:hypothetical protein
VASVTKLSAGLIAAGLVLSSCTAQSATPDEDDCRHPISGRGAVDSTFEEASFVVGGEVFRIYGAEEEPVRRTTSGEIVEVDGVPVWLLEAEFEVGVDDRRSVDAWRMWLGFHDDDLVVLCAAGPSGVVWPS